MARTGHSVAEDTRIERGTPALTVNRQSVGLDSHLLGIAVTIGTAADLAAAADLQLASRNTYLSSRTGRLPPGLTGNAGEELTVIGSSGDQQVIGGDGDLAGLATGIGVAADVTAIQQSQLAGRNPDLAGRVGGAEDRIAEDAGELTGAGVVNHQVIGLNDDRSGIAGAVGFAADHSTVSKLKIVGRHIDYARSADRALFSI